MSRVFCFRMKGSDEMCNFYMMYYSKDDRAGARRLCWNMQVPHADQFFPPSADMPAPFPGYAGDGK